MNAIDLFTLKKLSGFLVDDTNPPKFTLKHTPHVIHELGTVMDQGYAYDDAIIHHLIRMPSEDYDKVVKSYHKVMNELRGGDLTFKTLKGTFADDAFSESTYFENLSQLIQYCFYSEDVGGHHRPRSLKDIDVSKLQSIKGVSMEDVVVEFKALLTSKDSITSTDLEMIPKLIQNHSELANVAKTVTPTHREIKAVLTHTLEKFTDMERKENIGNNVNIVTDALRVAVAMSGGDVSLSEPVTFRKFSRSDRRFITDMIKHSKKLQQEFNFYEDLKRYSGLWKTLAKAIHVGDYGLHETFKVLREDEQSIETFHSIVENGKLTDKVKILSTRPTEFTRKLNDLLVKHTGQSKRIMKAYDSVSSQSSLNSLISAYYHFGDIERDRFVMPKSGVSTGIIPLPKSKINSGIAEQAHSMIDEKINENISQNYESMSGEYYIDPVLFNVKLPTQMRNASDGLMNIPRYSRIPIEMDEKYLRLFIHWIGEDVDLSVGLLDEDFKIIHEVAYYSQKYKPEDTVLINHSGDYTYAPAPMGASEFIDIDMEQMKENATKVRYIVMYVNVYSGVSFNGMEHAVCGWTSRKTMDTKHYIPNDVKQKVTLESGSRECIPMVLDMHTNEIVWCDMSFASGSDGGDNLRSRGGKVSSMMDYVLNNSRMSVGELITRHVNNRGGQLVDVVNDDTVVYNVEHGLDVNYINSNFL